MSMLPVQLRRQGAAAEATFMDWLDRCELPYMYVEQSPLTVPEAWRGEIKRPDFLVGVATIGMLAFDVKAKTIYGDHIIVDAYEHRTLRNFETCFNTTVWYACFPPGEANVCHLFKNLDLDARPVRRIGGKPAVALPLKNARLADPRRDFMAALIAAVQARQRR